MKKSILAYSLVLICTCVVSANNNPKTSALSLLPQEASFVIDLNKYEGSIDNLLVEDQNGKTIFSDDIEPGKQRIKYVLEHLPADVYTVKVKGDELAEHYVLSIANGKAQLVSTKTYSRPSIVVHGDRIKVNIETKDQSNISFKVFNSANEMIFLHSEKHTGTYQKVFNLDQLSFGQYRVLVSTDEFTKQLTVSHK